MIRKQDGALHVHISHIQLIYSNSNKGQFHTMAPDGLAAARAVDMLRSRTGLIPAHAAQLLVLADGSIEAALALYTLEPTMFDVSQHSLLCHPSLRSDAVELPRAKCCMCPSSACSRCHCTSFFSRRCCACCCSGLGACTASDHCCCLEGQCASISSTQLCCSSCCIAHGYAH